MSMKAEVIGAMWLYGQEYSQGRLSAIDFYASLSPYRKRTVGEMVAQIGRAHAHAALEASELLARKQGCWCARLAEQTHGSVAHCGLNPCPHTIADAIRALREGE